jgi:glucosylceramidase
MRIVIYILLTAVMTVLFTACEQDVDLVAVGEAVAGPQPRESDGIVGGHGDMSGLKVFTTAKDSDLRITASETHQLDKGSQPTENEISIFVNPAIHFQTMLGFGGAITDASAEVFASLSSEKQAEFLEAYYGETGLKYSLARTTIHSADFSSGSYTYIDEGDAELESFSIEHDRAYRIPLIKRAIQAAGGELLMYASPWSPPAFMKDSNNMLKGGKLLPEFYQPWANYYTRFIKAYEEEGIPIWGITIQNEPMATQSWESSIYSAEEERDFLKNFLGPSMERAGLGDKKIIVWDHNRDLIGNRANTIFGDPEAAKYAWGIGYHWYEVWTGSEPKHNNLQNVYHSYPDKKILFTEGTIEKFDAQRYQYWPNAERYAVDMINDFNSGVVGWTDWNILLDQNGGPNHVGYFCFAPIHADTTTGELIYTPTYYYLGHFSRFIQPGAKRVSTTVSQSFLVAASFVNPDGSFATVILNTADKAIDFNFYVGDQEAEWTIPARAIQTVVY